MPPGRPIWKKRKKDQSAGANVFHVYKQKGSGYYSLRIMVKGKLRRFSTGESSIKGAKAKAKVIMADIQSRGFEEAVRIHSKHRDEVPLDPTIVEFSALYRSASSSFDRPPSRPTRERYVRSLERVAELAKVGPIARLDEGAVELFKRRYLETTRDTGRNEESLWTTLNGIIRNAAALFSAQALQGYRRVGLELTNPFAGTQMKGIRLKSYSPLPRDLVDSIWKGAAKLRDGDKKEKPPEKGLRPRETYDFREPHRDAYALLLLELGLGLRRNETDKAEWDWFFDDTNGRRFIEVRETAFFLPKSKQSRVIPVEEDLWTALQAVKSNDRFVVDGPEPLPRDPERDLKSAVYRCDRAHRTLVAWLRRAWMTRSPAIGFERSSGPTSRRSSDSSTLKSSWGSAVPPLQPNTMPGRPSFRRSPHPRWPHPMSARKKSESQNPDPEPVETDGSQAARAASGIDEFAWKVAQLATSLLSVSAQTGQSASKEWAWAGDYFTGQVDEALSKAHLILDRASGPARSEFHLHEYFQPSEVLNPTQICRRLADIGWWSTTRPTLSERLNSIQQKWSAMLDLQKEKFVSIQDHGRQSLIDLEKILDEFCKREGVAESLPEVSELSRKLVAQLHQRWLFADEESHTVKYYRYQSLFDWCFPAEKRRESTKAKEYRFHEILRVAADHEWLPIEFKSGMAKLSVGRVRTPRYYAIPKQSSFEAYNNDGVKSPLTLYPW